MVVHTRYKHQVGLLEAFLFIFFLKISLFLPYLVERWERKLLKDPVYHIDDVLKLKTNINAY